MTGDNYQNYSNTGFTDYNGNPWNFPTYSPPAQQGWVCPKCGRVHAPFITMCFFCVPSTVTCQPDQGR